MFEVVENSNSVIFFNQKQLVKIVPLKQDIFRIVCTQKNVFSERQSLIVNAQEEIAEYTFEDDENTFYIKNGEYTLEFTKDTGRITIKDCQQKIIVSEPANYGRMMTEFDSYKNIFHHEKEVQVISGVDGVRSDSDEFTRVFHKTLYKCKVQFMFGEKEAIYGFGSHEEGFGNLRGKYRHLYQQNMKACVPYFYSTNGYGCLFDANCFMIFEDNENGSYVWLDAVEELDYYFICGKTFDKVTSGYRYLTGKVPMLPKWAFGYCQSKERYKDAEELIQVVEEYRKRQVPLDLIILDWQSWPMPGGWGQKSFDSNRFPDPAGMIQQLHELNAKFMISIWPRLTDDCPNHIEMKQEDCMLGNQTTYNAFSEKARKLYWKQAEEGLFRHGVDAWWCDCTEPFEDDWRGTMKPQPHERVILNTEIAKKYMEEENISAYSLLHSKGIYEGQRAFSEEKRVFNLTRSSYAGQHRYGTVTWAGDTAANWETLKRHIPEGVNFCASGEPYWTVDIGAFFVKEKEQWFWKGEYPEGCDDLGYRELYTRWLQYGTFLPIFRSHGTDTPREIWNFGEKGTMFYDAIEKFIGLRYQLMPYIYSLAGKVTHEDYTFLRALAFDFKDEKVKNIDYQFMFGDALMVCPITRPMYYLSGSKPIENGDKLQTVYLPKDTGWYDFWTGEYYEGGQEITKEYPIDSMPLFVKAGSILPMTKVMQYTDEEPNAPYEIRVYAGADAEFTLYDDDGDNYTYENGNYALTKLSWNQEKGELTIHEKQGDYASEKRQRNYNVVVITQG